MSNANRWITKLASLIDLGLPAVVDGRRHPRMRADFPVWVSSQDGAIEARCLDLNRTGMAVQTADALLPGALVFLRIGPTGLAGFAHVRHCRPVDGGHVLGLQFRGELVRERPIDACWLHTEMTTQLAWDEAEA